mmetsp:Transcript_39438/g.77624  ORF Transcript_39438/g.77624 Transcript_39438/m.77624 type:complete len:85 (+) Transcript_39438:532-786(+)
MGREREKRLWRDVCLLPVKLTHDKWIFGCGRGEWTTRAMTVRGGRGSANETESKDKKGKKKTKGKRKKQNDKNENKEGRKERRK